MNLLERLQQGQTQLSAGSFPGDAPINDPQSGFVQDNLPTNTYENETVGQPNNGSTLVNTLDNTGLDTTNFSQTTGTPPPTYDWVTNYPPLAKGEFNGTPSLYGLAYTAENTYLDNVPIQDPNSPQLPTLAQTGLDNNDTISEPTTITPNSVSYPNNYPSLVSGEFNGAPSQYQTIYNPNSTYLDQYNSIVNVANPQIDSLNKTGMDVEDLEYENTTFTPPNPDNITTYPAIVGINLGVTGSGAKPFYQTFTPSNTYWDKYQTNRSLFDRILA
jgi:hypothetical protein